MTTVKTASAKKATSTNGWNEENTAVALQMYREALGNDADSPDTDHANSPELLTAIKDATGAKSIAAVRSKLTSEKVYIKPELPRKVGGGSSVRKLHFVRAFTKHAIDAGLIEEDEKDAFDSLESGKMSALKLVAEMLNITVTAD